MMNNQTSLGGSSAISPEEELRQEKRNAQRRKYRCMTVVLVGIMMLALGGLVLTLLLPRYPKQLEWSEWMEELPEYAANERYVIEEQILYRSRNLETTTAVGQSEMSGWELYETRDNTDPVGEWSAWTESSITATDMLEVESRHEFRFRTKDTTSSTDPSMDGWVQYAAEDTTIYGEWSSWWPVEIEPAETVEVETKTLYRYPAEIYYDGEKVESDSFFLSEDSGLQAGYKYEELILAEGPLYGSYQEIYLTGTAESTETLYRSRTKTSSITYFFYRWSDWSDWASDEIAPDADTEVQERDVYRSRELYGGTIYCFRRWSEWSDYSTAVVLPNDTTEVEIIKQYRFKSKDGSEGEIEQEPEPAAKTERIEEVVRTIYSHSISADSTPDYIISSTYTFTYDGDHPQAVDWSYHQEDYIDNESSMVEGTGKFDITNDRLVISDMVGVNDTGEEVYSTVFEMPKLMSSGSTLALEWDIYGRQIKTSLGIEEAGIRFVYTYNYTYTEFNARNQPTLASVELISTTYDYDTLEILSSHYEYTFEQELHYDADGRLTSVYTNDFLIEEYTYDEYPDGRMVTAKYYDTEGEGWLTEELTVRYAYD